MSSATFRSRMNIDTPHIKAAFEEMDERARQTSTGKRKPPKPNMLDICSGAGLGAEAKDNAKIEARRSELKREAEHLARSGQSCVKP